MKFRLFLCSFYLKSRLVFNFVFIKLIVVQKSSTCLLSNENYAIAMLTKYEHCQCSMAVQSINGAKIFMKPYTNFCSSEISLISKVAWGWDEMGWLCNLSGYAELVLNIALRIPVSDSWGPHQQGTAISEKLPKWHFLTPACDSMTYGMSLENKEL